MAVRITHVRMNVQGAHHEHIERVRWENPADGAVDSSSVPEMVHFLDVENGQAYTGEGRDRVEVGVVRPTAGEPHIRTHADGLWTNNLLAPPPF